VRHDFSRILAWVSNGEEVAITKHRRTVARLMPARASKTAGVRMPDIAGRLQKVFGRKVISDKAMGAVLDESRGAY
jgi:antitoxin (DNA-binding transcriptional repressor) of toxin-antitoxin stability system